MLSYTIVLLGLVLSSSALPAARQNNNNNAQALQSSLTIDPSVIQTTGTGQNPPVDGQSNALVSKNNFANFCALTLDKTPITNGLQTTTGSCNPTPIGLIPASDKMPSGKFQNPKNGDTIPANQAFTISLAVKNIQLGTFTNAQQTYFANPQTLNAQGQIIGHTHVVIEAIPSLDTTQVTDPQKFFFFKGINAPQNGQGIVTADVTAGVPPGTYRLGTIMSSATHQPCIVPIAQHGILDDVVYFTAVAGGAGTGGNNGQANNGQANNGQANNGQANNGQANNGQANNGQANNGQANNGQANNGKGQNNGQANNGQANNGQANNGQANNGQANNGGNNANQGQGQTGGNLQKFTGALGGKAATPVTAGGSKGFVVNGSEFTNLAGALGRSCDEQKNACANVANGSGGKAGFTVSDCEKQSTQCRALIK